MPDSPLVIAHRGASGYLPEHTREAKVLAHAQAADFLEQDVVATRDQRLIVFHDTYLDRATDVAAMFPGRARADGRHYVIDFDWQEISALTVTLVPPSRRLTVGESGERARILTLEEEIELVHGLNDASGRRAGIYTEIKHPGWHADHGVDLSRAVIEALAAHGYVRADDPVYVQCFDATELRRVRFELGSRLRLVQLVGRSARPSLLSRAGLEGIAEYADALGPNYRQLLAAAAQGEPRCTPLVARTRAAGLALHPYTFNRENLPSYASGLEQLLGIAYELLRPEAVFCDYPDVAVSIRKSRI